MPLLTELETFLFASSTNMLRLRRSNREAARQDDEIHASDMMPVTDNDAATLNRYMSALWNEVRQLPDCLLEKQQRVAALQRQCRPLACVYGPQGRTLTLPLENQLGL